MIEHRSRGQYGNQDVLPQANSHRTPFPLPSATFGARHPIRRISSFSSLPHSCQHQDRFQPCEHAPYVDSTSDDSGTTKVHFVSRRPHGWSQNTLGCRVVVGQASQVWCGRRFGGSTVKGEDQALDYVG